MANKKTEKKKLHSNLTKTVYRAHLGVIYFYKKLSMQLVD